MNDVENTAAEPHSHEVIFTDNTSTVINVYDGSDQQAQSPVFLVLPALGVRATFYSHLAVQLAQAGVNAITMDWRGNGRSSVRTSRKTVFGYHEVLTIDLPGVVEAVGSHFPDRQIYLLGHSLGGQLGLLYASIHPGTIDGFVLLTGGSNYYRNLKIPRRYGRYVNYQLMRLLTFLFGYFPGDRLGFAGRESKTMMRDWLHECLTGRYSIHNNPNDFERTLGGIQRPVLFMTLRGDHFVTANCARVLAGKLKKALINRVELDASDYNLQPFTHFNWRRTPEPFVDTVMQWLVKVS